MTDEAVSVALEAKIVLGFLFLRMLYGFSSVNVGLSQGVFHEEVGPHTPLHICFSYWPIFSPITLISISELDITVWLSCEVLCQSMCIGNAHHNLWCKGFVQVVGREDK